MLSVILRMGLELIITSHSYTIPSSYVPSSGIVYIFVYTTTAGEEKLLLILFMRSTSTPSLLHTTSTLLLMPVGVVITLCSINGWPTVGALSVVTITLVELETEINTCDYSSTKFLKVLINMLYQMAFPSRNCMSQVYK